LAAARYVPMNPVRARLAARPGDWPWSSARAHLAGTDHGLVAVSPLLHRIGDFAALLTQREDPAACSALRAAETTGRPLGNAAFIEGLERILGRRLARGRPGPKPASAGSQFQQRLWG
jgi:putative transposase